MLRVDEHRKRTAYPEFARGSQRLVVLGSPGPGDWRSMDRAILPLPPGSRPLARPARRGEPAGHVAGEASCPLLQQAVEHLAEHGLPCHRRDRRKGPALNLAAASGASLLRSGRSRRSYGRSSCDPERSFHGTCAFASRFAAYARCLGSWLNNNIAPPLFFFTDFSDCKKIR